MADQIKPGVDHPHNPNIIPPTKVVEPSGPSTVRTTEVSNPEKDRQLREKQAEEKAKHEPIPLTKVADSAHSSSYVEKPSQAEQGRQDREWEASHPSPSQQAPLLTPEQDKRKAEEDAKFKAENRPPSTPILRCKEEPFGCREAALHNDDATKKGWYQDTHGVWYCRDHGTAQRATDQSNRGVR